MSTRRALRVYTPEERVHFVSEYERSGLSIRAYAESVGIPTDTLENWLKRKRQGKDLGAKALRGPHKPEERKQAIEAFLKSGLSQVEFAPTWGISQGTLSAWIRAYNLHGAAGLESPSLVSEPQKRGPKGISGSLKREIVRVKKENPDSGLRKVRHFLMRFRGVKVSTGTINKTLKAEGIPATQPRRRRRRAPNKIKRFERARAMQLWQSDITSFVLPRHGQRAYLVVFLDDHSRYVVAWNLQLRQTSEFVVTAVLQGIERFGKPQEILTDQGRQYFTWRGKCDFQKLLIKQGIRHVVARSHHPQTVGKCERLWETINAELWDRTRAQDLEDARTRLEHFFKHYNHFRPHQGIDGMVPADRFFGVESEVRRALEQSYSKNELRLAVGEKPRSPVFLIGQIGDQPISMHGEAGKLVVHTPTGEIKRIDYEDFGHAVHNNDSRKEERNEREEPSRQRDREEDGASSATRNAVDAGAPTGTGESALGDSKSGAEREGPPDRSGDSRVLDGASDEGGGSNETPDPSSSSLAAGTTGDLWYAGGASHPAQNEGERRDHGPKRGPEGASEENSGARGNSTPSGHAHPDPALDAGMPGSSAASRPEGSADECNGSNDSGSATEEKAGKTSQKKGGVGTPEGSP